MRHLRKRVEFLTDVAEEIDRDAKEMELIRRRYGLRDSSDSDLVDPAIWPRLIEWLNSLPRAADDDIADDVEPFV